MRLQAVGQGSPSGASQAVGHGSPYGHGLNGRTVARPRQSAGQGKVGILQGEQEADHTFVPFVRRDGERTFVRPLPLANALRVLCDRAARDEVFAHVLGLIVRQHPSRILGFGNSRERLAEIRSDELTADAEFVREFLGPDRFLIRHFVPSLHSIAYKTKCSIRLNVRKAFAFDFRNSLHFQNSFANRNNFRSQ